MADFMIRFCLCNVFLSVIIGILFIAKKIFKNHLSSRMQYNLWFLLLILLAVPFLPYRLIGISQILLWFGSFASFPLSNAPTTAWELTSSNSAATSQWMNDFTLSVSSKTPSTIGSVLGVLWIGGMFVMTIFVVKSFLRLHNIKKSALPLQNMEVRRLYHDCLKETGITKKIPVYSSAFLKSPIMAGLFRPSIYLPIHLISDYQESEMRHMLLHELQHYRHKDTLANYLINVAGVVYWFNPVVWYALKEIRCEREIACDASVLKMLSEDSYAEYGNTLIRFAEKVSLTPFLFTAGIGGNKKQICRRIINIASYEKPTLGKKLKGTAAFTVIAVFLIALTPILSAFAADESHYSWKPSSGNVSYTDFSSYFKEFEGSFVLYDLKQDTWKIHNMDRATSRVSPDSTYKIYNALFGLEEEIITPKNSFLPWNHEVYPIEAWNSDQTLPSAMRSSVNWYFQTIDKQLGTARVRRYFQKIGYGNQRIHGDLSSYWMESSLKISPVEQVELLIKLHDNSFDFAPENVQAVKDALFLSAAGTEISSGSLYGKAEMELPSGNLYGKTGTGRVDDRDVNGWFVGFVETRDNTYFFATNIAADHNASGSTASEITLNILSDYLK